MKRMWLAAGMAAAMMTAPMIATPGAAYAQGGFGNLSVIDCQVHDAAREQADLDVADAAMTTIQAFNRGDGELSALQALLPGIDAALAHAPDRPSQPEHCGDTIVLYSGDFIQMMLMTAAMEDHPEMGATKVEQREPLPYALLAFEAGWIRFEAGDYAGAHTAYEKGRRNDPDDATLVAEDSYALALLGRDDEALAVLDAFLAGHEGLDEKRAAMLQRKRGYALIDLGRLDEAEAAYAKSLEQEPGNATAQEELDYIRKQKAKS